MLIESLPELALKRGLLLPRLKVGRGDGDGLGRVIVGRDVNVSREESEAAGSAALACASLLR